MLIALSVVAADGLGEAEADPDADADEDAEPDGRADPEGPAGWDGDADGDAEAEADELVPVTGAPAPTSTTPPLSNVTEVSVTGRSSRLLTMCTESAAVPP